MAVFFKLVEVDVLRWTVLFAVAIILYSIYVGYLTEQITTSCIADAPSYLDYKTVMCEQCILKCYSSTATKDSSSSRISFNNSSNLKDNNECNTIKIFPPSGASTIIFGYAQTRQTDDGLAIISRYLRHEAYTIA